MTVRELFEWASDHDLLDAPISLYIYTDEGTAITKDITITDYNDGEIAASITNPIFYWDE